MKNISKTLILIGTLLFAGFLVSCTDEEKYENETYTKASTVHNDNNPYDRYGENMTNIYIRIDSVIQTIRDSSVYDSLNLMINSYKNPYPKITRSQLNTLDTLYVKNLLKNFNRNVYNKNVVFAASVAENDIRSTIIDPDTFVHYIRIKISYLLL